MKDEIKGIIDKLKDENNYQVDCNDGSAFKELFANEINLLLDYITDLQEELKYRKQAEQEYNEKRTKLMKKYKELQERKNKAIEYGNNCLEDIEEFDEYVCESVDIINLLRMIHKNYIDILKENNYE